MALAFDVPFAVGHRARTTCGPVAARMSGIPSIPEEYARPAFIGGPQLSACPAAAGRSTLIGIRIEVLAQATVPCLTANPDSVMNRFEPALANHI